MALPFKLQLVVVADSHEQVSVDELIVLTKDHEQLEHMGLNLAEAKALLLEVQRHVVSRQKPWRQGSQGHLHPHLVRQAGAGEPAVASLSVSAR
jgi:hypothetical protein